MVAALMDVVAWQSDALVSAPESYSVEKIFANDVRLRGSNGDYENFHTLS
jgi:hypothetical protein